MKKLVVIVGILLAAGMDAAANDCSCTSPSGNCSANISCPKGCYAVCGSICTAGCSSSGPGMGEQNPTRGLFSFEVKTVEAAGLSETLSKKLGVRIAFVSPTALNLELHDLSLEDLMDVLSQSGAVAILHGSPDTDLSSSKAIADARFSLRAINVEMHAVAEALAQVSGGVIAFSPRDPSQELTLDIQQVSARDLVQILSGLGQLRLAQPAR